MLSAFRSGKAAGTDVGAGAAVGVAASLQAAAVMVNSRDNLSVQGRRKQNGLNCFGRLGFSAKWAWLYPGNSHAPLVGSTVALMLMSFAGICVE